MIILHIAIFATLMSSSLTIAPPTDNGSDTPQPIEKQDSPQTIESARDLLSALSAQDEQTKSLGATVRYTVINALENDRQTRHGKLAIRTDPENPDQRDYAVLFHTREIDDRREDIAEHFIFDGRWFVERFPQDKQFNKRELVPAGETLDPMALMRDAPFWVSLGHDQDRLLESYNVKLMPSSHGLIDNEDFPELRFFADLPNIKDAYQLELSPKAGSGSEDDWEWVRIWIAPDTLHPVLYIKADWTGDLQIVELWSVLINADIPDDIFDTTTPDARSGWRIQISNWRGNE